MKNQGYALCGAAVLMLAGQAFAGSTWMLANTPTTGVEVAAYANTWGANTAANANNNGENQTIKNATLATYGNSMIGISNADACTNTYCDQNEGLGSIPEHAIDNNQRYDMALLSFTDSVKLANLKLGYISGDSDLTVMAYTGAATFDKTTMLVGKTYSQLTALGWSLVGNYGGANNTYSRAINEGGTYSSYWLIGAYNPLAGGATNGLNVGDDHIKLTSVSGCVSGTLGCNPPTTSQVPEPGTLALFGIGALGLIRLRKTRQG